MIVANSISKSFPEETVLENLDLRISPGEFVTVVGPSGCGKSTLLRLVAGLDSPSSGELLIDGKMPLLQSKGTSTETAYVFQAPTLLPWRTVRKNVELPLELQKKGVADRQQLVTDALRLVGLHSSDEKKLPRMLSGGMQMRVSLARAVVTSPRIMLLDEPFGALDDILRQNLNEELTQIWRQQKWTTLFVTHNVSEAVFMSERVLVMGRRPGQLIKKIKIPFRYPRTYELRNTPEFAELTGEISRALHEASA